jgi:hypothetical protein
MMAFYTLNMKTALNQLGKWILDYEKVNGTPTICEIKVQLEMFRDVEKEQITEAFNQGMNSVEYFLPNNTISESEQYYKETFIDSNQAII